MRIYSIFLFILLSACVVSAPNYFMESLFHQHKSTHPVEKDYLIVDMRDAILSTKPMGENKRGKSRQKARKGSKIDNKPVIKLGA